MTPCGGVAGLKVHKLLQAEKPPRDRVWDLVFRQHARGRQQHLEHFAQRAQREMLRIVACVEN